MTAAESVKLGANVALVDLHPEGGLHLVLGGEHLPGLRWADLPDDELVYHPTRIAQALPRWHGVACLSADGRGKVVQPEIGLQRNFHRNALGPNNSNIIMTANQAAEVLADEINVEVIPSKTIPQGLSACTMYNPTASISENVADMNEEIAVVKTGEVTYAIKDTNIDGVSIRQGEYMSIVGKDILSTTPDKVEALQVVLKNIIDDDVELLTLVVGEDVNDQDVKVINSYIEDNYDLEVELIFGKQPVYSFIVGAE